MAACGPMNVRPLRVVHAASTSCLFRFPRGLIARPSLSYRVQPHSSASWRSLQCSLGGGRGPSGPRSNDGNGGGSEDDGGNQPPGLLPLPLLLAIFWCFATEVVAVVQYRAAARRDVARRRELFCWDGQAAQHPQPPRSRQPANPPAISIIIPALNEEAGIAATLRYLQQRLQPAAAEIIVVDGGSTDRTASIARRCGVKVVHAARGRAAQMNSGAAVATGDILVFAHADTQPPESLVSEVRRALGPQDVVLGGFRPLIEYEGRPLRFFSANNASKTYYGPLLLRPLSFLRGLRCLFGDQTLFCRAADFRRVGGYDGRLPIMEDADLCIRLHMAGRASRPRRRGRVVQVNSVPNRTSGRRLASWGRLHATMVHVIIGLSWYCGATPAQLRGIYNRLYTDVYR